MGINELLLCVFSFIVLATILQILIIYVANDAEGKKEIRDFFKKNLSLKEFLKMIGSFGMNSLALFIIFGILLIGFIFFLKFVKFVWYRI